MKGSISIAYRQLVLREQTREKLRVPLTAPVNDLLGLSRPSADELYVAWLWPRYEAFGKGQGFLADAQDATVKSAFLKAAEKAQKGQLGAEVAPFLERLRFGPDNELTDVPDFVALAAWSLLEALRRQQLKLLTCPMCRGKWLGSPNGSKYCQRIAPDQSRDCRTLAKEKRLASDSSYRAYRREYKRIQEAHRRGTVDTFDLLAWRKENGPASWKRFEQWKATRAPSRGGEQPKEDHDG